VSAAPQVSTPGRRFRVALEYGVTGDLRFLAHHDELRMLTRALVRAAWPLAYTRGFNPRPRLTIPLPRNLGTETAGQLAQVDLATPCDAAELYPALADTMPLAAPLRRVIAPGPVRTALADSVTYEVDLTPAEAAQVAGRIPEILDRATVTVQRESAPGRPTRPFDIRPFLERLEVDSGCLRMRLRVEGRTARPSEVLTALGLPAAEYACALRRVAVRWNMDWANAAAAAAPHERNQLGYEEINKPQEGGEFAQGARGPQGDPPADSKVD
jgi:radical SAM-linked protein